MAKPGLRSQTPKGPTVALALAPRGPLRMASTTALCSAFRLCSSRAGRRDMGSLLGLVGQADGIRRTVSSGTTEASARRIAHRGNACPISGCHSRGYARSDLTRARAGPTCARQLADWGADAIKIELSATTGRRGRDHGGATRLRLPEPASQQAQPHAEPEGGGRARHLPAIVRRTPMSSSRTTGRG